MHLRYQYASSATDTRCPQLALLLPAADRYDRVNALLHYLHLRVVETSPLRLEPMYHDAVVQVLVPKGHDLPTTISQSILIFILFPLGVSRRVPILLQILLYPLRKLIVIIGQDDHLVIVVHIPEYKLQIALLLPLHRMLAPYVVVL